MSLDFDSGALQTQHEDEDYDQEDYAREQELQQLLTDLPHDMLEDSGDQLSSFSDCSIQETEEQSHEPGKHDGRWNDHPLISDPPNGYEQGQNLYPEQFLCDQQTDLVEKRGKNWNGLHNDDEKEHLYDVKEDYCGQNGQDDADDVYLGRDGFNSPSCYQENNVYHLPENFRPYPKGHKPEFNNQQNKIISFPDDPKEHLKQFVASDVVNGQSPESYKVTYKPYQNGIHQNIPGIQEGNRRNEVFEDLQHEFLGNDENSSENMQILQLQVLNKARERQLEELNEKLEKSAQQIRYLNHQLSMVKDEKDGLALSLHESQKLYQNGKERELHLEGQIKALETQIQTLTTNEEQILKQSKVAEVAMESLQKQLLELQRSDALQRAREQHEAIISALKQKYEQQVLSLEQKLDTTKSALREQKELCKNLGEHVKQLEKLLEETKCEKTEIINRLTRSLEESQKQCANLLQTGSMQETNQLRFQLQQAQSAQMISNNMNKALQEELMELKEEIALYESAAKLGVFLNDAGGERHMSLGDSYVDLGIKKITGEKPRFCSAIQNRDIDKELSKDEIIVELKAELERLLSSNKMKRNQITQLQNSLQDCQKTLEEYKQLKAEKASKDSEPAKNLKDASDNLKEEVLRLKKANEALLQEVEAHTSTIEELKENEEKLKSLNQDLCCQMRKMVEDFDHDKQEAIDRCERTYQQHHEDTKAHFEKELMERFAAEKQRLVQTSEETISQLKASIEELNKEMTAVKECYIGICQEKDTLETTLRQKFQQEQQLKEEKLKKQLLEEKEVSLKLLKTELEEEHTRSMIAAKKQWLEEKEQQVQEEVALAKAHWEKEEKELALVLSAAEEKWKKEYESTERSGPRMKELEEKIISLRKELELKKEEIPAAVKAELAKARVQWNKEKQEEILQIQEQNERDYRSFLDDHRNRIKEVLATAKEDLAKQKNELSIQKEAEIKMLLDQKQREWEAQEAKRLQDEINRYEEKTLLELEYLLSEIHEELVKCTHSKHSWKDKCFDSHVQLTSQGKEKLKTCLQKAYRTTVCTILEKKEREWKEKYEELVSNANKESCSYPQHGAGDTGDVARPPVCSVEHQAEAQRRLRTQTPLQETGTDKENEEVLRALIAEDSEMKMKLKDQGSPPRSLSRGGISKPCASSDSVKGLEEMRAHYIKAVSKIKCDMLCYIRESKERAAEMIKVEVLRERQETARKMRKYYLTCLQQLLTDNGKHEGAEKKIMDAASKLATMAKGLETPLRHIPQRKATRSALHLNSDPGAERSRRDCVLRTRSHHMESKSCSESSAEKATDKVVQKCIPRDLKQQFDATQTKSQHVLHETVTSDIQNRNNSKNLDGASRGVLPESYSNEDGRREKYGPVINVDKGPLYAVSNDDAPPSAGQVTLQNMQVLSATNGHTGSGPTHHMLKSKNGRTGLKEDKCIQSCGKWRTKSKRIQEFDFKDTPERDEGSSSEWSSENGSLHLDCGEMPLLYPQQKANTNVQAQTGYCEEFPHVRSFSPADENVTWRDISSGSGKILSTKSSTKVYSRDQQITNPEHTSFLSSDKSNSAVPQLNASSDSNAGKCCKKCLEKNGVGSPVSSAR
ncbi:PREDICTED: centrosomal protein of 152 kDa isoform X3 [Corvus brachyrhynchos]|uniref:centrosomal protein of 152 kDa isoform X3 n=1 Tax=Corvus brachyrhynchos TaxID=85066 RepID=UPI000816756A|nr:PREDICTED: centrosomal protein of 152 kDa isoform X3 [Corvus brachyrhynchos]